QLGNRVQHALRAFTPRDQKAVRTAAQTMRQNPRLDTEQAITELGVGEALVSLLDEKGRPGVVERAFIMPPASQIGPITPEARKQIVAKSLVAGRYEKTIDRESAHELLAARAARLAEEAGAPPAGAPGKGAPGRAAPGGSISDILFGSTGPRGGKREGMLEAAAKSAARSAGSQLGRAILRGVLGSILGGKGR
ncbi:MAG: DUF853 domain-containing protein, partial [Burkholderiales bacterium]|nr:DUF853 domain-containing protein [Burkholderiales bacterium]